MTRTLPLAILCAMSGALVGALVGFGLAWIVLSGTARAGTLTSAVPSGRPYVEDAGTSLETTQAGSYGPVTLSGVSEPSAVPLPLAAPVQLDDGGGVSSTTREKGWASYVNPGLGSRYLALPEGPGHRVTICAVRCITRTSTDAGPDLERQRAGIIADLSFRDFATVCSCSPATLGHVRVTVSRGGSVGELPATDTP